MDRYPTPPPPPPDRLIDVVDIVDSSPAPTPQPPTAGCIVDYAFPPSPPPCPPPRTVSAVGCFPPGPIPPPGSHLMMSPPPPVLRSGPPPPPVFIPRRFSSQSEQTITVDEPPFTKPRPRTAETESNASSEENDHLAPFKEVADAIYELSSEIEVLINALGGLIGPTRRTWHMLSQKGHDGMLSNACYNASTELRDLYEMIDSVDDIKTGNAIRLAKVLEQALLAKDRVKAIVADMRKIQTKRERRMDKPPNPMNCTALWFRFRWRAFKVSRLLWHIEGLARLLKFDVAKESSQVEVVHSLDRYD